MTLNIIRQSSNLSPLIGATSESAATDHTSTSGLNGLLKAILRDFRARIPVLINNRVPVSFTEEICSTVTITPVTVGTTSIALFPSNANRLGWAAQYNSTTGEIYIAEGVAATTANGRVLAPDFERVNDLLFRGTINAIGTVAGTTILTIDYSL